MINEIVNVFWQVFTDPFSITLLVFGVLLGIVLGALPGISSTMSLAVLLPVSFSMSPEHGMIFLMGVFSASVYGGSISAILISISPPHCAHRIEREATGENLLELLAPTAPLSNQ